MIGKTDYDLPWGALADIVRADDEEVIDDRAEDALRARHRDGRALRTVVTSKLPLLDGEGQTIGVLGSYHDVTDQKRAELALRLQSRALDASVNAILITGVVDGANVIEYANPAFKRITGYDPSEVIGQDCRFLQGADRDQEGLARSAARSP